MKNFHFKTSLVVFLFLYHFTLHAQVRIRLFTTARPEYLIFSVDKGEYEMSLPGNEKISLGEGHSILVVRHNDRLAVKLRNEPGFYADSAMLKTVSGGSSFSLSTDGNNNGRRSYTGDLKIVPDLGTILAINYCNIEDYVAGVVQAEAGNGRYREFFMTQAVIARTYMHRNNRRHEHDGYDLCDDTHCQVYYGTATNTLISEAVKATEGLVIVDKSNVLINPAFHSNCGGETSPAEFVWLAPAPYLKSVKDPYCKGRTNSSWQKTLPGSQWIEALMGIDHEGRTVSIREASFNPGRRTEMYRAGKLSVPLRELRDALGLRSAFFSVSVDGANVILKGKGFGHGVGLCQEGAIVMAGRGFDFRKIIDFYYTGVKIEDVGKALAPADVLQL